MYKTYEIAQKKTQEVLSKSMRNTMKPKKNVKTMTNSKTTIAIMSMNWSNLVTQKLSKSKKKQELYNVNELEQYNYIKAIPN